MDLLNTNIFKLYKSYLLPAFTAAIVHSIYGFIDTIAIGQGVGTAGVAALSIVTPLFSLFAFFGTVCGIGGAIRLGFSRGKGHTEKAQAYFTTSAILILIFIIIIWITFCIFSTNIYRFLGANDYLMPFVKAYADPFMMTSPFFLLSPYLAAIVRADGAPELTMHSILSGAAINIFLDWFLVFPLGMGMLGASLATIVGTAIQALVLLTHFFRKKCTLRFVLPYQLTKALFKVLLSGLSAGVLNIAFVILTIVLNNQVMRYGNETALAVFGVVITCTLLFQSLFTGVGQAIQPIVSTNFGAGLSDRIRKIKRYSLLTEAAMGIFFTLLGLTLPLPIIRIFIAATPEVTETAPSIIRIYFLSFLFMGCNILATYYFQSIMKTRISTWLSILRGLALSCIFVYVLPLFWGLAVSGGAW